MLLPSVFTEKKLADISAKNKAVMEIQEHLDLVKEHRQFLESRLARIEHKSNWVRAQNDFEAAMLLERHLNGVLDRALLAVLFDMQEEVKSDAPVLIMRT